MGLQPRTAHDVKAEQAGAAADKQRLESGEIVAVDPRAAAWKNASVAAAVYSETEALDNWHKRNGVAKGELYWAERGAILEQGEALLDHRAAGKIYDAEFKVAAATYAYRMAASGYSYELGTSGSTPTVAHKPAVKPASGGRKAVVPLTPRTQTRGMGEYGRVGGHHVHAKAAFRGHATYDARKGFSVSQEYMAKRGWSHEEMTASQQRGFRDLRKSGRPNTMAEHSRIAREALVAGGATRAEAASLVRKSLANLRRQKVKGPSRIPWEK